jgi:hypothetical protein
MDLKKLGLIQIKKEMELTTLKQKLILRLEEMDDQNWKAAKIIFQFSPTINMGYQTLPVFTDKYGIRLRFFL